MDIKTLKKAGLAQEDLLIAFNTIIRPTLEYAAPTFHSMLMKEMSEEIENIQKRSCKIIFGWDCKFRSLVVLKELSY